jgi:hypothetical protein
VRSTAPEVKTYFLSDEQIGVAFNSLVLKGKDSCWLRHYDETKYGRLASAVKEQSQTNDNEDPATLRAIELTGKAQRLLAKSLSLAVGRGGKNIGVLAGMEADLGDLSELPTAMGPNEKFSETRVGKYWLAIGAAALQTELGLLTDQPAPV